MEKISKFTYFLSQSNLKNFYLGFFRSCFGLLDLLNYLILFINGFCFHKYFIIKIPKYLVNFFKSILNSFGIY
jgi:hypothetical protein